MFDRSPEEEMADSCRRDDSTRARELLAYGVSARGMHRSVSFLSIAVSAGAEAVVRLLLDADADAVPNDLSRAVRSGSVPVAALILDNLHMRGVAYDFWNDERPLLTDPDFLRTVTVEMVEWMLVVGCDPTERDRSGFDGMAAAQRDGVDPRILELIKAKRKR